MATLVSTIETAVRFRLEEPVAKFWSSAELVDIIGAGIRDLWRDVVDLKQEHFITISEAVTMDANTGTLTGVPADVHKIVMIAPLDNGDSSSNRALIFRPADYNSGDFQNALSKPAITPSNDTIFYAITAAGAPVAAPTIRVAPHVTSEVTLSFAYVPTVGTISAGSTVPIPGEADNAIIAWTVAFARAKEREDRAPDPNWLMVYGTEKAHLLKSLELRQYQEPSFAEAVFEPYW